MKKIHFPLVLVMVAGWLMGLHGQEPMKQAKIGGRVYPVYPATLDRPPGLPSPCAADDGAELITAQTRDNRYALVPVTVGDWLREEVKHFDKYVLAVDRLDFPSLALTGLHSQEELDRARTINGRPLAEINEDAKPGRLSASGFMAEDEDVLSILRGDDRLVRKLGLTHPRLARPLLHLWNLVMQEQKHRQGVWNGRAHAWVHFDDFLYNGKKISYGAIISKGTQLSPFKDGVEGVADINFRREMEPGEEDFLKSRYGALGPEKLAALKTMLTRQMSGEMEPFYIVRYGFYEGHTPWRTDPIALASIFGLRSLAEIEAAFPGDLHRVLTSHYNGPAK